jgi:hypothetical protein
MLCWYHDVLCCVVLYCTVLQMLCEWLDLCHWVDGACIKVPVPGIAAGGNDTEEAVIAIGLALVVGLLLGGIW